MVPVVPDTKKMSSYVMVKIVRLKKEQTGITKFLKMAGLIIVRFRIQGITVGLKMTVIIILKLPDIFLRVSIVGIMWMRDVFVPQKVILKTVLGVDIRRTVMNVNRIRL